MAALIKISRTASNPPLYLLCSGMEHFMALCAVFCPVLLSCSGFALSVEHLVDLPDSLQQLMLRHWVRRGYQAEVGGYIPAAFSHLTAVTALRTLQDGRMFKYPPNLVCLHDEIDSVAAVEPLLSLTSLQRIDGDMQPHVAVKLAPLTNVSRLSVQHAKCKDIDALGKAGLAGSVRKFGAGGPYGDQSARLQGSHALVEQLARLPNLVDVRVWSLSLGFDTIAGLTNLSIVSRLVLGCEVEESAAFQQLPIVLDRLTSLEVLCLNVRSSSVFVALPDDQRIAWSRDLARMRQLRTLTLIGSDFPKLSKDAKHALAAATQLTEVVVCGVVQFLR